MEPIDQLIHQNDQMRTAAIRVCDASQDFARAANGHIIPAATAYDLLATSRPAAQRGRGHRLHA